MKLHTALHFLCSLCTACLKIVVLVLLIPLFIIFICPIYITRFLVMAASKIIRPDLVTIIGVRDMFYAVDDTKSPKSSIVVTLVFRGQLKKEMLLQSVEKSLTKCLPGSKALMYPELKRYLVKWMGFLFWKEDVHFLAENHVQYVNKKLVSGERLDEKVLKDIERGLVQEGFPANRSPWCINILQNYQPLEFSQMNDKQTLDGNGNFVVDIDNNNGYSVALFKVHHSFVDGFSLLNLIMKEFVHVPEGQLSLPNFPRRTFLQNTLINLILIFKAPYDILSSYLLNTDVNPWYLQSHKVTGIINSATSHRIPTQRIKNIAKATGSSFTGVVVSAISGGIGRCMKQRGEEFCQESSSFTCMAPFPIPGHPDTLGNYLSDCFVEFPVAISDPIQRLKRIEGQLKSIKYSTMSLSSFVMQPFFGGLFHWMVKPLMEFQMTKSTGVFSSFPCPRVACMGHCGPIVDAYFTAGHDNPGIGIQFLAINYNQGWKLKIQADKGTLDSDEEVENLLQHILKELDNYECNASDV